MYWTSVRKRRAWVQGAALTHRLSPGYTKGVPNWRRFRATAFEYDFDRDELASHRVTIDEAEECFFAPFQVRRDKSYRDRYQLLGRTFVAGE
jgi:hypothetical protein